MRAYLAVGRPDISETVTELAQAMSSPRGRQEGFLKRVHPVSGRKQTEGHFSHDAVCKRRSGGSVGGADSAGDVQSRRWTTGMAVTRGPLLLETHGETAGQHWTLLSRNRVLRAGQRLVLWSGSPVLFH